MIESGHSMPENIEIQTRVRDDSIEGDNPFRWETVTTNDLFEDKRVLVIGLPGAFTPTCSTSQVPDFAEAAEEIKSYGVQKIYVVSVNDAFTMRKWLIDLGVEDKLDFIPDGNCELTNALGMAISKQNLGMGVRSWRYAMLVDNMWIEQVWVEEGLEPDCESDPYEQSTPENVIEHLKNVPTPVVEEDPEPEDEEGTEEE